jgi:hypothetical protein
MSTVSPNLCIYCLTESTQAPLEHVVPEVLGCPEAAILRAGEVCKRCNNGLALLDVALADSFDFARLSVHQPSKRAKGPSVRGRSNFLATMQNGEQVMYVNLEPHDVTLPNGRVLKALDENSPQSVKGQINVNGQKAEIDLQAKPFQSPKFSRALHKVSIGVIAAALGREAALSPSLDQARAFVVKGAGPKRSVLCRFPSEWKYFNTVWLPFQSKAGYCVIVTLCGFQFGVDCTPNQTSIPKLLDLASLGDDPYSDWVVMN